jgi:pSer/pThr/pTyr-binding forkhead associated (FHA) protein
MNDPHRTRLGDGPPADPHRTLIGTAPTLNATQTIKPVQCPVCKQFNPPGVMFCVECGLIFDRALPEDAFAAPAVRLPVLVDSGGREHPIRPGLNILGRHGDVALDDGRVSRKHAQIVSDGESFTLEDLGSTNGTTVNGEPVTGEPRQLAEGDRISLGGLELVLALPGEAEKTHMPVSGRTQAMEAPPTARAVRGHLVGGSGRHPLFEGANPFGRKGDNAVVIADPYVSGRHGVIEVTDEGVFVTDLGSTNGTMINDAKLPPNVRTRLEPEDAIRLGALELRVELAPEGV